MKKHIFQDGNEFYQEMTDKELIHELEMALINVSGTEKILRESIENKLGYPIADKQKLSISSEVIKVPNVLYQLS